MHVCLFLSHRHVQSVYTQHYSLVIHTLHTKENITLPVVAKCYIVQCLRTAFNMCKSYKLISYLEIHFCNRFNTVTAMHVSSHSKLFLLPFFFFFFKRNEAERLKETKQRHTKQTNKQTDTQSCIYVYPLKSKETNV